MSITHRTRNRSIVFSLALFGLIVLGDIKPLAPGISIHYYREETAAGVWQDMNWELLEDSDFAAFMADITLFRNRRYIDGLGLFIADASDSPAVQRKLAISVPLWMPAIIVIGAWMMILTRLPTRYVGTVACGKCGYDLRATPDRCPECGTLSAK